MEKKYMKLFILILMLVMFIILISSFGGWAGESGPGAIELGNIIEATSESGSDTGVVTEVNNPTATDSIEDENNLTAGNGIGVATEVYASLTTESTGNENKLTDGSDTSVAAEVYDAATLYSTGVMFNLASVSDEVYSKCTNLVIISGTDGFMSPIVEAYHNLVDKQVLPYRFGLKVFSPSTLDSQEGVARVQEAILNSDAVLLEMVGAGRDVSLNGILAACEAQWMVDGVMEQPEIFIQRSGEKNNDGTWASSGFILNIVKGLEVSVNKNNQEWTRLNKYILNSGVRNWECLMLYLAANYGIGDVVTTEDLTPVEFGGAFVYHPAADVNTAVYGVNSSVYGVNSSVYEGNAGSGNGIFFNPEDYYNWYTSRANYDSSAPWVGILSYDSFFKNADYEMVNETLLAVERCGLNAILLFPPNTERNKAIRQFFYRDLDGDGTKEPAIDVFICAIGFQFDRGHDDDTLELFKEMDVPVLNPIYSSDLEKWLDDPAGATKEVYWQVALAELEGRIEPVLMGGTVTLAVDEATGTVVSKKVPIADRIERLAGRATAWGKLHKARNIEKKVAIIYYNINGGKDGITASYLNVPRSLTEILNAMKIVGYRVDQDDQLSDENNRIAENKVFQEIFSKGRNIGGWAPGELSDFAAQDGIIKIDLNTYLAWYQELPEKVRNKVEAEWGPPPGQVMVLNNKIIIPGIISDNVFFGPQPMRGWGEDIDKVLHSTTLPPTHQYLAFYFWLQQEFKADAVIHLGTHGTAEWLPGKAVGLSGEDWPDIVQGNMPNIYPYIVNNPGEGTQAKRRGNAVIIDHLTAAVANTELYGNLLELHDLSHSYELAIDPNNNQSEEEIEKIKAKIMRLLKDEGLAAQMCLDPDNTPFEVLLEKAHDYLHALEADVTPLGLHTFGVAPQGDLFEKMVQAIVNYDPAARNALEDKIRENLSKTTEEMDMLLHALKAGYIPPGLANDPVRNPDVMPTGRNFASFDPRTVPTKDAWNIGKQCADDLLKLYKDEHGTYPESIGVVLWAVETMRTEGQSIAMVMRLLGIEPVWDSSGRVLSYKILQAEELGRPRIDVVLTISGLFRDTFTVVNELLDKAIRELALRNESTANNYLKKHFEELKAEYIKSGKSENEAIFLAGSRIFGPSAESYGNGISSMLDESEEWNDAADLAELYVSRMGYIYGAPDNNGSAVYGVKATELLTNVLKNVQAVVQVRDSIYGALDNDDVAQYLGGLVTAAQWASGQEVDAFIANTRLGVNVQTFGQFVTQELHSRLLNPKFIEEMLKEGYAGSVTIAKWISNAFYVDATTGAIDDWAWHDLASKYVYDEQVRSQLDPYALQSLIATIAEASRKDLWQASQEDLTQLSNAYIETMVKYGVVCSHNTCNNITFNEWVAQFSTLDNDMRSQFEQKLIEATGVTSVNIPSLVTDQEQVYHRGSRANYQTEQANVTVDTTVDIVEVIKPDISVRPGENVQTEPSQSPAPESLVNTALPAQVAVAVVSADFSTEIPVSQVTESMSSSVDKAAVDEEELKNNNEQVGVQESNKAYEINQVENSKAPSRVGIWVFVGTFAGIGLLLFGFYKKRGV